MRMKNLLSVMQIKFVITVVKMRCYCHYSNENKDFIAIIVIRMRIWLSLW